MTFDQALNDLAGSGDPARAAMAWALDHWDQAGPRFTDILGDHSRGQNRTDETSRARFLIIHLQAEMEDSTVCGSLCRLLQDGDAAIMVLGDAITATLPRVLISTFDDDFVPALASVVETESTDSTVRDAALLAMAYLTHTGRVTERMMREHLLHWRDALPQEDLVWNGWVTAVACLGYADLAGMAEDLFERGLVDVAWLEAEDFREDLQRTLDDPQRLAGFDNQDPGPLGSAIAETWAWTDLPVKRKDLVQPGTTLVINEVEDWASEDYIGEVEEPFVNPLRGVGCNALCPCGSGKKHKKCCLV